MKGNVIMKSSDRDLFGVTIRQQTKDSFVSVTDLQRAYEKARWQYGWSDRKVSDILNTEITRERVFHLLKERDFIKSDWSAFMEMVKKEGLTKVLKGLDVYKTTGRGENKMVMCDPYIWVLLAMELNPLLYAKVVIWITDTLIFDRIDAGTEYKPMNSAIKSVVHIPDYSLYARTINERVFGEHKTGMRQLASSKELRLIADIEKFIIQAIKNNYVSTEAQIIKAIKNY